MTDVLLLSLPSQLPLHCPEMSGGYKLKCKDEWEYPLPPKLPEV